MKQANLKNYQAKQLWMTPCGLVVELTYIDQRSSWGVIGNVIHNLEKSSFYEEDEDEEDDGIDWAWSFTGNFDASDKERRKDTDLVKEITRQDNPEYFI